MSNDQTFRTTQAAILSLASIVGVVTFNQISNLEIVHRTRLTRHMSNLVNNGYVNALPGRHYYAGIKGRASPVYQLTSKGARFLRQQGNAAARASGLTDPDAVNHALAMLDCRLMLERRRDGEAITDQAIPYGETVLRPDNLFRFKDERRLSVMVETEGIADGEQSLNRIRKKVANLTDFFLSAEGKNYDNTIRIIYLWKPSDHSRALSLWTQACHRERLRRGMLPTLPFKVVFFPHWRFTEYAQLEVKHYEALPPGGTQANGDAMRIYQVAAAAAPVVRGGGSVPVAALPLASSASAAPDDDDQDEAQSLPADGPLLDEGTLSFLDAFKALYEAGIDGPEALEKLLSLVHNYLSERLEMAERLGLAVALLYRANNSYMADCHAMEDTALTLFRCLRVPAYIGEGNTQPVGIPVTVQALGDGHSRPALVVKISSKLGRRLLMGWRDEPEALAHTFENVLRLLFNHGNALDILFKAKEENA